MEPGAVCVYMGRRRGETGQPQCVLLRDGMVMGDEDLFLGWRCLGWHPSKGSGRVLERVRSGMLCPRRHKIKEFSLYLLDVETTLYSVAVSTQDRGRGLCSWLSGKISVGNGNGWDLESRRSVWV